MQNDFENFSQFGYNFQVKLVYLLINDSKFLQQISDVVDKKYFENDSFSWCVDKIKEHFLKYKNTPSIETIAVYVKEISNSTLQSNVKDCLRDVFKVSEVDLNFVRDKTVDFFKNQALKEAIYNSVDLLKSGQHNEVRHLIDNALKVGIDTDIGHDYTEMIQDRMTETSRKTVSTGWDVIDNITDGGLGPGELGVVLAPSGIGKSWSLVSLALAALYKKLNVIYYTMELGEKYVGKRFDSSITGISSQNLKFHEEEIHSKVSEIKGNLIIKYYPTKTASIQTLRAHIEKVKMVKGFNPDIIFVDYADLLVGVGKEKRFQLENIYEELRSLAGQFQIPVWTASQSSRSSIDLDIIEADKIAESYGKVATADFIISLSRKINDKMNGTARWHIVKSRIGKDGDTFPSKFNAAVGHIEIFEPESNVGKDVTHKMKDGNETVRKLLKRRFDEIEGESNISDGFE